MAEIRQLARPPILEALIDIRFSVRNDIDLLTLRPAIDEFAGELNRPDELRTRAQSYSFDVDHGVGVKNSEATLSHLIRTDSDDAKLRSRYCAVQRDGVSFSYLNKYAGWDKLISDMNRLFQSYVKIARPEAVVRLGVRYINRIQLPNGRFETDDYLTCGPKIPPGHPGSLTNFSSAVAIITENPLMQCVLNQSLLMEPAVNSIVAIVNIDAFRADRFDPNWESIREPLERLRALKNGMFFGSVTEKALEACA